MTIVTVKTRLALMEAQITGIRRAFAQQPSGAVADADLPFFINFAREAVDDYRSIGSDQDREGRMFLPTLYVFSAGLGTQLPAEGEALAEPWIATVKDYFRARPSLSALDTDGVTSIGGLKGVQMAYLVGDSGPRMLQWGGQLYWGIEFKLNVVEYLKITFAQGE
jgi:hypothetical protein